MYEMLHEQNQLPLVRRKFYISKEKPEICIDFDDQIELDPDTKDLINKFCCERERRIGSGQCMGDSTKKGLEEIKLHPFFKDFQWKYLRKQLSPVIDAVEKQKLNLDILRRRDYYKYLPEPEKHEPPKKFPKFSKGLCKDLFYLNYTFKRFKDFKW